MDAGLARQLVEEQFPILSPASIDLLGSGWDNTVFRVNDQFVAKFTDTTLTEGRLGLCVAGAGSDKCTVYFDNFAIYMPP